MNNLIISLKDQIQKNLHLLPDAFRQIEIWANSTTWHPLTFAANCSQFNSGAQNCAWCLDPFGFIHMRGVVLYTGTINAGVQVQIASISKTYAPVLNESYDNNMNNAFSRLDVNTAGRIFTTNLTGVNQTNPFITIPNITYSAGF
jgi:hypothetical protein